MVHIAIGVLEVRCPTSLLLADGLRVPRGVGDACLHLNRKSSSWITRTRPLNISEGSVTFEDRISFVSARPAWLKRHVVHAATDLAAAPPQHGLYALILLTHVKGIAVGLLDAKRRHQRNSRQHGHWQPPAAGSLVA